MAKFKDSAGREWVLTINVPVMKRVQDRTGHHLGKLFNDDCKILHEITSDPITFGSVLYAMAEPQAVAANVSEDAFLESLSSDAIDAAGDALLEAVQDFSPSRTRPLIAALRNKGRELAAMVATELAGTATRIAGMNPMTMLSSTSSPTASEPLASSESTPAS